MTKGSSLKRSPEDKQACDLFVSGEAPRFYGGSLWHSTPQFHPAPRFGGPSYNVRVQQLSL